MVFPPSTLITRSERYEGSLTFPQITRAATLPSGLVLSVIEPEQQWGVVLPSFNRRKVLLPRIMADQKFRQLF
jgi:hypothetical protein